MIYLEHVPGRPGSQPCVRVFSNVDSHIELDKFRCEVRAPAQAFINGKTSKGREHLLLFGNPRDIILKRLSPTPDRIFATPIDRVVWETTRPEIMKNHPVPYLAPE